MAKQTSFSLEENAVNQNDANIDTLSTAKKQFIEPELSMPVDVLEATTFFQAVSSGATN